MNLETTKAKDKARKPRASPPSPQTQAPVPAPITEDEAIIQANANFRYHDLPKRYRRAYLQTESSTNYLSLRSDIAFTVAVLTDLISRLDDPILSDDLIQSIHQLADHALHTDALRSPTKANRLLKQAIHLADLTNQIEQQHTHLREIRIMQKHLILLVETERKRLEAGHNAMSIEDVFSIIQNTTRSIKRNAAQYIEDPNSRQQFLEAIANDQDRELSLLGYAKTPLPEFTDPINTHPSHSDAPTPPSKPELFYSEEPLDSDDIRPEDVLRHTQPVIDEFFTNTPDHDYNDDHNHDHDT